MIKKGLLLFVSSLLLSACTYSTQPSSTPPTTTSGTTTNNQATTGEVNITISNFTFNPQTITVKTGSTVTILNNDSAPHTVTSDDSTSFNTDQIAPGTTGSFTAPTKAGTYSFHCSIHKSMTGTLIVQ